jgi:hypothetical protein
MGDALGSIPSTAETKKTKLSLHTVSKVEKLSQELCLPSVVPATQEVEIRRIKFQEQPKQKVQDTPSQSVKSWI